MHAEKSRCCFSMESQGRVVLKVATNQGRQAALYVHDSVIVVSVRSCLEALSTQGSHVHDTQPIRSSFIGCDKL